MNQIIYDDCKEQWPDVKTYYVRNVDVIVYV